MALVNSVSNIINVPTPSIPDKITDGSWDGREASPNSPYQLVNDKFDVSMATAQTMLDKLVGGNGEVGYLNELEGIIDEYPSFAANEIAYTPVSIGTDIGITVESPPSAVISYDDVEIGSDISVVVGEAPEMRGEIDVNFGTFDTQTPTQESIPTIDLSGLSDPDLPVDATEAVSWLESVYDTSLYSALIDRLTTDLTEGATGIGGTVEQEIYDRAIARQNIEEDKIQTDIEEYFSSSGFELPTGAMASSLTEYLNGRAMRADDINGKILIEQAELAQKNNQFAIETVRAIELSLKDFHNKQNDRSLDYKKAIAANTISRYTAQIQAYVATLEADKTKIQIQVENIKAVIESNKGLMEAFTAEAEVYGVIVDAKAKGNNNLAEIYQADIAGYGAETKAVSDNQKNIISAYNLKIENAKSGLEADVQTAEMGIKGYDSETKAISENQKNIIDSYRLKIENATKELDALVAAADISVRGYGTEYSLRERVSESMANIAMQAMASSYGAVNASAGLSYNGSESQSESWSHNESRSDSYSHSESISVNASMSNTLSNSLSETHSYEKIDSVAKFIPPTKILFSGNTSACSEHIKFALNQLAILERQMELPRKKLKEGRRVVTPYDGVHVECISSYSNHEVHIHVDQYVPVVEGSAFEFTPKFDKEPEPEFETPLKALYYVRIENPYPDTKTDRLVLYEMSFDGGSGLYNSSKEFSPGKGSVIADVDLTSNTLIYPTALPLEEKESLLLRVEAMLPIIPDRLNQYLGVHNYAYDWYTFGPLRNRVSSAYDGEYTVADYDVDNPLTLSLSDPVTGLSNDEDDDDVEWWTPTDHTEDLYSLAYWRAVWSPKHTGDTRYYMDMYPWSDFEEAAQYYGTFLINSVYNTELEVADEYTYWDGDNIGGNAEDSIFRIWSRNIQLSEDVIEDRYELIGGFFCTPVFEDPATEAELDPNRNRPPTFFIAHKGLPGGVTQGLYTSYISPGGDWDYAAGLFNRPVIAVTTDVDTIGATITPLETIYPEDWIASINPESCEEFAGTYWDTLPAVSGEIFFYLHPSYTTDIEARQRMADLYGQPVEDLMYSFDPSDYIRADITRIAKNSESTVEKTNIPSFFIMDEPEYPDNPEIQTKFCSLLYLDESIVTGVSGVPLPSNYVYDFMCDYAEGDGKQTFYRGIGCLVYIFAPPEIYSESEDGTLNYWDIHSARVSEGTINPYRCLDLEEYLMTVFTNIGLALDENPNIDKLVADPPRAHALSHYGFSVTGGFVADTQETTP